MKQQNVAVIGGGVCGLGIGWRLAQAGCDVHVFDRGEAGKGASWAAAGMLAARAEAEPGEEALLELNKRAQEIWPAFMRDLETATGQSIGYRDEGTLIVAPNRDDAEQLRFTYEYQTSQGLDVEWLTPRQVSRKEPYLAPGLTAGVYSPSDHQVDNRALTLALKAAFLAAGGQLHENTTVVAIETSGGRAAGLRVDGSLVDAKAVVLAAGAWSREIDGLPEDIRPPVRPLKGQMMALQMDPNYPILQHVLWAPEGIYLVPRRDGRLLIGATVEERGFDTDLTAGGLLHLLRETWEVLPGIDELPVIETWVGFRPTSRDDAPILGPTAIEGLIVATGHHRNGILLTPLTANAVSHYILTRELTDGIDQFGPHRFDNEERDAEFPERRAGTGE
ncbi:MAG: glycine oxidase ThiO [Pseudomonadota bacterium]|nr:glycine oxidase ThiO [Pseudomonadota bacterium]